MKITLTIAFLFDKIYFIHINFHYSKSIYVRDIYVPSYFCELDLGKYER